MTAAGTAAGGTNGGGNNNGKQAVGTVTGIVPVGGQVAGAAAFEGQAVGRQDVISTEANGKIIFSLGQQVPFCQVETASEVEVTPGGATLVEVRKGTALCRTSTNGQLKQFVAGGTVITAADPVFLVGWDGDTATVQVAQGYVRLENDRGTAVVGANQQAQSGSGGIGIGPWEPSSIPDGQTRDAAATQLDQAASDQPAVRYPRLDPSQSPILADGQRAGGIVIDVAERQLQTFVQELLGNMGALWDVGISVQSNTDRASIVVTDDPPSGRPAVALADLDGTTYFAVLAEDDPALADAMRSFLAASLQVRCPLAGGGPAAPGQSCYEDDLPGAGRDRPRAPHAAGAVSRPCLTSDEVLGLRVVADDGRRGLLGLVLPARLLAHVDAEPVGAEQAGHGGVVLQIGARRIAPRVAPAAVLLAEQAADGRAVLGGEAPLLADAVVPVLGQRLGHLHAEAVQHQVVLVAVLGEQGGRRLRHRRAHGDDVEGGVVDLAGGDRAGRSRRCTATAPDAGGGR